MSSTIRELLDCVTDTIERAAPDAALLPAAAAVIGHCARSLRELSYEGPAGLGARRMYAAVLDLAQACDVAASTWPSEDAGRAEPLAGAAADAIAQAIGPLPPAARWALAVAVAELARRCADRARAFPPLRAVPELVAVRTAAAGVEQVAAMYPPSRSGRVALDHAVPRVRPPSQVTGLATAAAAAPALAAAVHAQVEHGTLTVAELLACARAAEIATQHAVTIARAIDTPGEQHQPWVAAPAAWRAVHRTCAPFDDGTKARPSTASDVIAWAAYLERAVHEQRRRGESTESRDLAEGATAIRAAVNQLPDLAENIERAVARWSRGNCLLARERRLASFEDRNLDAALATDRVVFARGHDLDDLAVAAWDARRLSANLAGELDRSSAIIGHQTQPALAAAHAATTRSAGQSVLRVHAQRAQARAAATAGSRQWSFAPRNDLNRSAAATAGRGVLAAREATVEAARLDPHATLMQKAADRMPGTDPDAAGDPCHTDLRSDTDDAESASQFECDIE
jgi:hypothetical protein